MFMVLGANSCFANIPPVIETQVEFISELISRASSDPLEPFLVAVFG
jgi:hypothetical protein